MKYPIPLNLGSLHTKPVIYNGSWRSERGLSSKKILGQGEYSTVYEGEHLRTPIALKTFNTDRAGIFGVLLAMEVAALNAMGNGCLYIIHHVATFTDAIAFELVNGKTLERLIEDPTLEYKLPQLQCYVVELAMAVVFLHAKGFVHRDIKSANVMVSDNGDVKLLDLGYCCPVDATCVSDFVGTPLYLAPEVLLKDAKHMTAADIYAFGCLCWEMQAGTSRNFEKITGYLQLAMAHRELKKPAYPLIMRFPLDPQFDALIHLMLSNDFAARPTATEVKEAMLAIVWRRADELPVNVLARNSMSKLVREKVDNAFVIRKYYKTSITPSDTELSHPNIVRVAGWFKDYCELEELQPRPLTSWIADLSVDLLVLQRFALGVVAGVAYLHQQGLTNNAICASELFLSRDGTIKIVNFDSTVATTNAVNNSTERDSWDLAILFWQLQTRKQSLPINESLHRDPPRAAVPQYPTLHFNKVTASFDLPFVLLTLQIFYQKTPVAEIQKILRMIVENNGDVELSKRKLTLSEIRKRFSMTITDEEIWQQIDKNNDLGLLAAMTQQTEFPMSHIGMPRILKAVTNNDIEFLLYVLAHPSITPSFLMARCLRAVSIFEVAHNTRNIALLVRLLRLPVCTRDVLATMFIEDILGRSLFTDLCVLREAEPLLQTDLDAALTIIVNSDAFTIRMLERYLPAPTTWLTMRSATTVVNGMPLHVVLPVVQRAPLYALYEGAKNYVSPVTLFFHRGHTHTDAVSNCLKNLDQSYSELYNALVVLLQADPAANWDGHLGALLRNTGNLPKPNATVQLQPTPTLHPLIYKFASQIKR